MEVGSPGRERRVRTPRAAPFLRPAAADPMSEDDRLKLVETVAEAHTPPRKRRRLTSNAPATKAAVKAEQESFRLMRELQRLELADPGLSRRCEALAKRVGVPLGTLKNCEQGRRRPEVRIAYFSH